MFQPERLTNDRDSITFADKLRKKESRKSKYKRLKDYTWGMGLEHEMQVFHKPSHNPAKNITEFIMFNSTPYIGELLKGDKITVLDKEFLSQIPFEPTGRKCAGKVVLPKTPINMPEFITEKPFSSLKTGKRPIESYCVEIKEKENRYFALLHLNDKVVKVEEKYGQLNQFPFGVCNYFKYPLNTGTDYRFKKNNKGKDKLYTDYLGSYHLTLTLPFTEKTPLNKFIKMHQNFANQIQWIEPLLIAAFFSSDEKAVGTSEKRIKGSYRIVRVGWGNLAGSDVRKFNEGIGRYADILPYWRDGLDFYNMRKTNYCKDLSPELKKKEPGAVSGFSSNFRTFGSTDPARPWHRESGISMTKPNGIELRIFDHFDSYYLPELCKLAIYVAENSRVHQTKKYVYKDKNWIKALQTIMMNGWNAELPKEYIDELKKQLNLKIRTKSRIAYDVLYEINQELFKLHRKGDWTYLMLEKEYKEAPKLPQINRQSWETGLMLKLNRDSKLMDKFNRLVKKFPNGQLSMKEFEQLFFKYYDKKLWKRDVIDFVYFLESIGFVTLSYKMDGNINFINKNKEHVRDVKNFNNEIIQEWNRPFLEDFYYYITKIANKELKKRH